MAYYFIIRNGTVIDGNGVPRFRADVAASNGRIAAIGKIDNIANGTIDATGKIVSPGFVDPHTHYDAQLFSFAVGLMSGFFLAWCCIAVGFWINARRAAK